MNIPVSHIFQNSTNVSEIVKTEIKFIQKNRTFKIPALILGKMTDFSPQLYNTSNLSIPSDLPLSNEELDKPAPNELLNGAGKKQTCSSGKQT